MVRFFRELLAVLLMVGMGSLFIMDTAPGGGTGTALASNHSSSSDFGEFEVLQQLLGGNADIGSHLDSNTPFTNIFQRIIEIVIGLTVIIGVGMVVAGGYLYMTAQGSAEQVKTGKDFIKKALLAIVLALASVLLLNTISPQFGENIPEPTLGCDLIPTLEEELQEAQRLASIGAAAPVARARRQRVQELQQLISDLEQRCG